MPTAVVTGANRGIGLGLAQQLAKRGYDVIGTARAGNDTAELEAVATVVHVDVTDAASLQTLANEVGNVDLLINNAGFQSGEPDEAGPLKALSADALLKSLHINSVGPALVVQALADKLNTGAKIVNMTSGLGSISGTQSEILVGYSVSKAALNMITRQLSFDDALQDKIIIAMDPGWVQTRMGGAGAQLTIDESTEGIIGVVDSLTADDTGSFRRYDGETMSW